MNGRIWIFGFVPVMALFLMISTGAFGAKYSNEHSRIETFGVVSKDNPQAGTITITVNKVSKGLQDKFGKDVTFHTSDMLRVNTCSTKTHTMSGCWKQLSKNVGARGREADRAEQKVELSRIKNGDWVFVSGYFDKKSDRFVANKILKWPS
jgi:hypothetical protein